MKKIIVSSLIFMFILTGCNKTVTIDESNIETEISIEDTTEETIYGQEVISKNDIGETHNSEIILDFLNEHYNFNIEQNVELSYKRSNSNSEETFYVYEEYYKINNESIRIVNGSIKVHVYNDDRDILIEGTPITDSDNDKLNIVQFAEPDPEHSLEEAINSVEDIVYSGSMDKVYVYIKDDHTARYCYLFQNEENEEFYVDSSTLEMWYQKDVIIEGVY